MINFMFEPSKRTDRRFHRVDAQPIIKNTGSSHPGTLVNTSVGSPNLGENRWISGCGWSGYKPWCTTNRRRNGYVNVLYRVGSSSGPGPRARAGMGPVGGARGSPRGPVEPASPRSPRSPVRSSTVQYFVVQCSTK